MQIPFVSDKDYRTTSNPCQEVFSDFSKKPNQLNILYFLRSQTPKLSTKIVETFLLYPPTFHKNCVKIDIHNN